MPGCSQTKPRRNDSISIDNSLSFLGKGWGEDYRASEFFLHSMTCTTLTYSPLAPPMSTLIAHFRSADEELQEELLSAATHGLGLLLSAAAVAYLLAFVITLGGWVRLASCGVYGASLVMMYAASTALHSARRPDLKLRFQLYDHVAIYLLIAGTYTPLLVSLLQNYLGLSMLVCVWTLAAYGIATKLKNAHRLAETSPLPCLALGWLVLAVFKPLIAVLPAGGIALLVAGGISYSVGFIFYCQDDKRYFHAIWHLLVMAGTAFHFAVILLYVVI